MCGEAPCNGKAKMKFRARYYNYKSENRSYRIYYIDVFINTMGNTAIIGLMICRSHQLNNVKHTST